MWPHQSNSPTKTWGRQRHKIFWRQRLCWLVKYVNTNLPWSQFLTLVIQSFLKNLGRERIVFPAQPVFLCFQRCFRLWSRRYCVNWSLVFPRTDSKLELRLKIQYLNKDAINVVSESVLLAADVIEFATLGSLSNDDGDGNENGKKALGLDGSRFLCTFRYRCCTTTTWNRLVSRFIEDVNTRQQFSFSFSDLRYSPLELTPEKFPNIWQIKWNGIRLMKFEKARVHFFTDVFAAVAVA